MKPANFEYFAPTDLDEALATLEQYGNDAKILAGGQSLMPLMNMRLVRPAVVIDINRVSELDHISPGYDGGLAIGALTSQRSVERSSLGSRANSIVCLGYAIHRPFPDPEPGHYRGKHSPRGPCCRDTRLELRAECGVRS